MQLYNTPKRGCTGLSLIELLLGMTLMGLLMTAALPSFSHLLKRQSASQVVSALATGIRLTRQVAMTNQTTALFCPKAAGVRSCGDDWTSGQILFLDDNRNNRLDSGEKIVRQWQPLPLGSSLQLRVFGNRAYLKANTSGLIANQSGNFLYCPPNRNPRYAKQLIFNALGRVRLATDQNGDGIDEGSNQQALSCS